VKVGVMIAGIEVRHAHIHLVPITSVNELNFDRQDREPDPARQDADAAAIRAALRTLGLADSVPDETGADTHAS
jgi:diadenosine tetraphosphate (Ap4A) HIT family hydrolase